MNKTNLAYIAGFIDGEGCISADRRQGRRSMNYIIKVLITNVDLDVMNWIQSEFGGYLHKLKPRKTTYHNCYELRLTCRQAHNLLKQIYPYLKIKRELAAAALRIGDRCREGYDHNKSCKSMGRQQADDKDFCLMKSIISSRNGHNVYRGVALF